MKVLSYNIFYKTMMIVNDEPLHPKCGPIVDGSSNCLKNVSNFIEENGPYDFVCLQEATNWQIIQKITPYLRKMIPISYQISMEEIVTFYHEKYTLDAGQNKILGYMDNINRLFIILFFDNNLCLVNLHAGHNHDIYHFDTHLERILKENYDKKTIQKYLTKLKSYDIVMVGDFNENIHDPFIILKNEFFGIPNGRKMYGINHASSCCNYQLLPISYPLNKPIKSYDQIISTIPNVKSQVWQIPDASDHMPIIAIIQKSILGGTKHLNIGYDFDGVLHLDVTKADKNGQRYAISDVGPYRPFEGMINDIKRNLDFGNHVYLITARFSDHIDKKSIQNYLEYIGLPKVPVYFTDGQKKVDVIRQLEINKYYDDSCSQISEIYLAKKRGHLPSLEHIYFVIPEKHKAILITDNNFAQYCSSDHFSHGGSVSNRSRDKELKLLLLLGTL